jgi:hypothetical protein
MKHLTMAKKLKHEAFNTSSHRFITSSLLLPSFILNPTAYCADFFWSGGGGQWGRPLAGGGDRKSLGGE